MTEQVKEASVRINVNREVLTKLREERIVGANVGTVAVILIGLYNDELDFLDLLDEENKDKSILTLCKQLQSRKILEEGGVTHFQLTEKGKGIANFLMEQQEKEILENTGLYLNPETGEVLTEKELQLSEDWIHKYNRIFPNMNAQRRQIRMQYKAIQGKMDKFEMKYQYSRELILEAAAAYIKEQSQSETGHLYTLTSGNFIGRYSKAGEELDSTLAAWCMRLIEMRLHPEETPKVWDTSSLDTI